MHCIILTFAVYSIEAHRYDPRNPSTENQASTVPHFYIAYSSCLAEKMMCTDSFANATRPPGLPDGGLSPKDVPCLLPDKE